jgi:phosphoglycerate dehydrogenase-like enzyme
MSEQILCVVTRDALPPSFSAQEFEGRIEILVASTDDELRTALERADIMYSGRVPEIVPAEAPRLRWVQLPSAGSDHLRHLPIWESDVIITSAAGVHTVPMTEHVFAMLLALTRHLPTMIRAQERREWTRTWPRTGPEFLELRGKTLCIVGWGKIGAGVAHLARAFGMRVVGTRSSASTPQVLQRPEDAAYADPPVLEPVDMAADTLYPAAQLPEVLSQSDVVVVILPHTKDTEGLFGEAAFRAMKPGALFINMGRGAVVDEGALVRTLESGQLAGAGLDVFDEEPLSPSSPLWSPPNVIVSPHVGGMSERTHERAAGLFAVNLRRYLHGEPLLNVVDRRREY